MAQPTIESIESIKGEVTIVNIRYCNVIYVIKCDTKNAQQSLLLKVKDGEFACVLDEWNKSLLKHAAKASNVQG